MTEYNIVNCMSVRNRISLLQCKYRRKSGSEYCGVHMKQKKIKRIDTLDVKIYNFDEIFNSNSINNVSLIKTIKHYNLQSKIDIYQKCINNYNNECKEICKCIIFTKILTQLQNYINKSVIIIQSLVRGRMIRNMYGVGLLDRNRCINDEDFYTFENKTDISVDYFYSYLDKNIVYYFDIRSFILLLSKNNINPYTRYPIPDNVKLYVNMRKRYMSKYNIPFNIDLDILTDVQQLRDNMITVFNKYDLLGYYTNHVWLLDLGLSKLKKLYSVMEDIWNYRACLTNYQKSCIISSSIPFPIPPVRVMHFNEDNKAKVQEIILYEFNRFITDGINDTEKRLGSMLMLTALVEVSTDAASAYPHLIQTNF
jgi:hypothetical protein